MVDPACYVVAVATFVEAKQSCILMCYPKKNIFKVSIHRFYCSLLNNNAHMEG